MTWYQPTKSERTLAMTTKHPDMQTAVSFLGDLCYADTNAAKNKHHVLTSKATANGRSHSLTIRCGETCFPQQQLLHHTQCPKSMTSSSAQRCLMLQVAECRKLRRGLAAQSEPKLRAQDQKHGCSIQCMPMVRAVVSIAAHRTVWYRHNALVNHTAHRNEMPATSM